MGGVSAAILFSLYIHQIIMFTSVFRNERLPQLVVNLWHGINSSWLWNKMFWVSCMGTSILFGLNIH